MPTRLRRTRIDSALILAAALASCAAAPIRAPQTVQGERTEVPPLAWRIRGRVVDPHGVGVAHVPIVDRGDLVDLDARSGTEGKFELAIPAASVRELREHNHPAVVRLAVGEHLEFVTALASIANPDDVDFERVIVAAPRLRITGSVTDASGRPIHRAGVEIDVRLDDLAGLPWPLDAPGYAGVQAFTDERGGFALDGPLVEQAELHVSAPGFTWRTIRIGELGSAPIEVRLDRSPPPIVVRGTVRLADGRPADGAVIEFCTADTKSGGDGSFALEVPGVRADERAPMYAALRGHQAWFVRDAAEILRAASSPAYRLDMQLGPAALAIEGRVVDAAGNPLVGWEVELNDGTLARSDMIPTTFVEHESGGRRRTFRPFATMEDGRFRVEGLFDREYVLDVWDAWDDPVLIRSAPIRAGTTGVELVLPRDARIPILRGRLVDTNGTPVERARVEAALDSPLIVQGVDNSIFGPHTRTDASGRFELRGVDRHHGRLRLSGPQIVPLEVPVDVGWGEQVVDIVVPRAAHVVIDAAGAEPVPDRARFLGSAGQRVLTGGAWNYDHWLAEGDEIFYAGRLRALTVAVDAAHLVLSRDGVEIGRVPVALEPGRVVRVRWPPEPR